MSSSQTAKVTKLESLSDPEKVKKFIVDVTNAARKTEVKETKTDKTVVRGNLGMLIKARVIPYTCTGGAELPPCGRVRGPDSAAEPPEETWTFLGTNWPFFREK